MIASIFNFQLSTPIRIRSVSQEQRSHRRTPFVHVVVGSDGVPQVVGDVHDVVSHDLAVRQVGVGLGAFLGQNCVSVPELQLAHVSGSELASLDCHALKQSCSLVNAGYEGRTNSRRPIRVHPAVLFGDVEQVLQTHTSLPSSVSNLGQTQSLSTQSLIQGFS